MRQAGHPPTWFAASGSNQLLAGVRARLAAAGPAKRRRGLVVLAVVVIFVSGMPTAAAADADPLCAGDFVIDVNRPLDPQTMPTGRAVAASVPPGTYNLTLVSADDHHPDGEAQDGEQWAALLYAERDLVFTSDFTDDLATEDAVAAFDLPGTVEITSPISRLVPVLIDDGHSVTAVCAVFDVVESSNGRPVAFDDAAETDEGVAVAIDVLANDTDPDGDVLTASIVMGPGEGSVVVDAGSGVVTYTPDAGFVGVDVFTYEACDPAGLCSDPPATVTVEVVESSNGRPVAFDDAAETDEGVAVAIDVLANDTDPDGDVLTASIVMGPGEGSVVVDAGSGVVTYTPDAGFVGVDVFTYEACDPAGLCSDPPATVTVEVVESSNGRPVAFDDAAETDEGVAVAIDVLANDTDPDGDVLTASIVMGPGEGSVVVDAGSGVVTYTPDAGFVGVDVFTYEACDPAGLCSDPPATVTVEVVESSNGRPVAFDDAAETDEGVAVAIDVLANDTDPDGDVLTASIVMGPGEGSVVVDAGSGVVTYTPDAGFVGVDVFTYEACDPAGLCSDPPATVTVEVVESSNGRPVAFDDAAETDEGVAVAIDVLANDTDPDGDVLTASIVMGPGEGSVVVDAGSGVVTYTPDAGFVGVDVFTYEACDPAGLCSDPPATVTVEVVESSNGRPVAFDDAAETDEGVAVAIDVLANDTDPDGDVLTASIVMGPGEGSVVVDAGSGVVTYTPDAGFVGVDVFTYEACDPAGLCSDPPATVTVDVGSVVVVDDIAVTLEDVPVSVDVTGNDSGVDSTTAIVIAGPSNGSVVDEGDGSFTYSPAANFNGTDTFVYEACNMAGLCGSATVTVTVGPVNDAPVALADQATTQRSTSIVIAVTSNDFDPDGDDIFVRSVTLSAGGTAEVLTSGLIRYTPNPGLADRDSFDYELCDAGSPQRCVTGRVTVTITDPPALVDVEIDGTVRESPIGVGQLVPLEIEVSNTGSDAASGIRIEITLPDHVEVESGISSGPDRVASWQIDSLDPGERASLEFVVRGNSPGEADVVVEVVKVNETDVDSVPADGEGDDYAAVSIEVQSRPVVGLGGFLFVDENGNRDKDEFEGPPTAGAKLGITVTFEPATPRLVLPYRVVGGGTPMLPFGTFPSGGTHRNARLLQPECPVAPVIAADGWFWLSCGAGRYEISFDHGLLGIAGLAQDPEARVIVQVSAASEQRNLPLVQTEDPPVDSRLTGTVRCAVPGESVPTVAANVKVVARSLAIPAPEFPPEETDEIGTYGFELPPGEYEFFILDGRPVSVPEEGKYLVSLEPGQTIDQVDFLMGCERSDITGIVWLDANRNGVIDTGEDGRQGVAITLTGTSEGRAPRSAVTNAEGIYVFSDVPIGEYTVAIDLDRLAQLTPELAITTQRTVPVDATETGIGNRSVDFGVAESFGGYRGPSKSSKAQLPFPWWIIIVLLLVTGGGLWEYDRRRRQRKPEKAKPPIEPVLPPTPRRPPFPPPIPLDPDPPYPGPRPFLATEHKRFFGRGDETRHMVALTYANRVTVLFGPSGAGKTSLLVAGYIPTLDRTDFEVLPIVRFRADEPRGATPAQGNRFVGAALAAWSEHDAVPPHATLASWLDARVHLENDFGEPAARVLIFDQFEEIFAPYPERWQHRHDFFEQLEEFLSGDGLDRIVISIEETQLGALEPLLEHLDLQSRSQFRLEPLKEPQALEALVRPLDERRVRFAPGIPQRVVRDLRLVSLLDESGTASAEGEFVDPLRLQLVATAAWRSRDGAGVLTSQHLHTWFDTDQALTDFYDTAVKAAGGDDQEDEVRAWIEANLITSVGARSHVHITAAITELPERMLDDLELTGLLARNPSRHGDQYKLAHDRFVVPILVSNDRYRDQRMIDLSALLLVRATGAWAAAGRRDAFLLSGDELDEALALARHHPALIGRAQREFLDASAAAAPVR